MSLLVTSTKQALVDACNEEGLNAFYGWPSRWDNRGCVVVGAVSADYSRASFASNRRIRDQENWDLQISVVSGQHHRSPKEAEEQALRLLDSLLDVMIDLDAPEGVLWTVPERVSTTEEWTDEARSIRLDLSVSIGIRQRGGT